MARPLRVEYEGAIYHVTVRGNARRAIFLDNRDRQRFLARLADGVEVHGVRLYLFCLMTNHVHLMLETPGANLSRFMHRLQTAYAVYFNRRHRRAGHLTQGRYGARLVDRDAYLLRLSRYIHLNPVFVGRAKTLPLRDRIALLRKYPWSSYRSYVGRAARLDFVDYAPMLAMMDGPKAQRPREYRKFVEAGIADTDQELRRILSASPLAVGPQAFVESVRRLYQGLSRKHRRPEDIAMRRQARRLPAERVLAIVCRQLGVDRKALRRRQRGSPLRPVAATMLCHHAGLTQRQAAELLNLSTGAAVSLQLKKLAQATAASPKLRKKLAAIEEAIDKEID